MFVKLAYAQQIDAVTLLTFRMAFSLRCFLLIGFIQNRSEKCKKLRIAEVFAVLVLGLVGYYIANIWDFFGLELISAGLERLIVFLYPTLVIIFSRIFLGCNLQKTELVALIICYAGIAMILFRQIDFNQAAILWGSVLVFGSTVAYSAYLIGSYRFITRLGPYRFTALGMASACMACLVQFFSTHPFSALAVSNKVYTISACMALLSTVIRALFLSLGIQRIGPTQASLVSSVGPVLTMVLAYIVLGETISGFEEILGSGSVLIGVFSISFRKQQTASI